MLIVKWLKWRETFKLLERKLFLEEIALNVTDERCNFLDKNHRLLQNNESGLHRQSSVCHASLEELKLKQEACQFSQFQKQIHWKTGLFARFLTFSSTTCNFNLANWESRVLPCENKDYILLSVYLQIFPRRTFH
ncbi:hypothetical protein OS493_035892 [Desmophyllum pertusum]|uniref:Uncharacterized protein n=1 Tax=Desmophyllum pertusum TaxID=174260 RepID=A0A9W9Z6R9_9CNID|nr:hypothetical protein OS493_035892 [Desmophyllum pertusum]